MKIGEERKGLKHGMEAAEESGSGEDIPNALGETRGDAEREARMTLRMYEILTRVAVLPGEPVKGVIDGGGVVEERGASKKEPLPKFPSLPFIGAGEEPNGGGDAGEGGPPLEVPGGLIRFSFCRLERDQAFLDLNLQAGRLSEAW